MAYTTIDDPSVYFQTTIYTGNGGNDHNITNTGNSDLSPDWIWLKNRGRADNHAVYDTSRSPSGTMKLLQPNATLAEADDGSGTFVSFDTDGFTVGANAFRNNYSNDTYVAWQWKANGGTTTTNDSSSTGVGNQDSVYQANTTAGFSIVTWAGQNQVGTMAHGLGAVPNWIIVKARGGTEGWGVYHHRNTASPETDHLRLDTTAATLDSTNVSNDTAPTSAIFTVGDSGIANENVKTYVAYLFAEKQGYSKFGSYTGNADADGPFVYTGFKPAWVVIKNTSATANWHMYDNKRDATNPVETAFQANSNGTEFTTSNKLDFVSNGFKIRAGNQVSTNHDGVNYIYMAFAESPFVSSEGVPTTAR
jgi:hypothetical protein